jgi:hypothetical protein
VRLIWAAFFYSIFLCCGSSRKLFCHPFTPGVLRNIKCVKSAGQFRPVGLSSFLLLHAWPSKDGGLSGPPGEGHMSFSPTGFRNIPRMPITKDELLLSDLIKQVDPLIASKVNLSHLYRAIGDCILDHENRRDYSRDHLYRLFRRLQAYLHHQRGIAMPNPGQARNLAAAYRGIGPALIARALRVLDWPVHMALIKLVKETPARLFYLRKALDNEWDCASLEQAVQAGQYQTEGHPDTVYFIRIKMPPRRNKSTR